MRLPRYASDMSPKQDLEKEITSGLTELQELVGACSTYSVAGWCFSYFMHISHSDESADRLSSPAKQIPFLLAVLLAGEEPKSPENFGKDKWERTKSILDRLFIAYMSLYMPSEEELGTLAPEWHRVREVSMSAFLHYFNTGLLASVHQVEERITTYLAPFDADLSATLGISASQALSICRWINNQLQESLDDVVSSAHAEREERLKLLDKAMDEHWSLDDLKEATRSSAYPEKAEQLFSGMNDLGHVTLPMLDAVFPGLAEVFWGLFSIQRGEAPEIRYPTEQSVFEARPLIRINDSEAFCPLANALFTAVLRAGEQTLLESPSRDNFLRARDKALEDEALAKIRCFLSPKASVWSRVYETPDRQYEHDVVAIDNGLYLFVEAKASPPIEPFRDPEKAFVRLRDAFRGDTGIQKAYDQGNRIVRKLKAGDVVRLFDARGDEVCSLSPDPSKLPVSVCVTRDNFGLHATNLALLLEKDAGDSYPWVVNVFDLDNLAEAWSYFGWGPAELREYLEQRILLHGKVFSDDELDYAGFFIRHGNFDSVIAAHADFVQLTPEYSGVFDDLYRHLHLGGPPVELEQTEPVQMDLRRSLASDQPVFVEGENRRTRPGRKIGRNKPCPCGSGKKYKRCCGADR